jgi:hypothetical protein
MSISLLKESWVFKAMNQYREITHVIQKLQMLTQHWGRLLFTMGGSINLQKSFWYLIAWKWKHGKTTLATIAQTPVEMSLSAFPA